MKTKIIFYGFAFVVKFHDGLALYFLDYNIGVLYCISLTF